MEVEVGFDSRAVDALEVSCLDAFVLGLLINNSLCRMLARNARCQNTE